MNDRHPARGTEPGLQIGCYTNRVPRAAPYLLLEINKTHSDKLVQKLVHIPSQNSVFNFQFSVFRFQFSHFTFPFSVFRFQFSVSILHFRACYCKQIITFLQLHGSVRHKVLFAPLHEHHKYSTRQCK